MINSLWGLLGFSIVFFVSLQHNYVMTSVIRGLIVFAAFYIATYVLQRFLWHTAKENRDSSRFDEQEHHEQDTTTFQPLQTDDLPSTTSDDDVEKTAHYISGLMEEKEE